RLQADVTIEVGEHPHQRRVRGVADQFHRLLGRLAFENVEPSADRAARAGAVANPGDREIAAGLLGIRLARKDPEVVFVDAEFDRLLPLALDRFAALAEVEPFLTAAKLPARLTTRTAIFDEEVARVGSQIGDTPREFR